MKESFYNITRERKLEYLDRSAFSPCLQDLHYGSGEDELVDLYYPPMPAKEPWPVILQVHGGGWVYGDKSMDGFANLLRGFLSQGFAVASMRYSLAPAAHFPVQFRQVQRAIQYLQKSAASLGLSEDQIFLYGNSAGAYLVLLAAVTQQRSSPIRAAASVYGVSHPGHIGIQFQALKVEGRYTTGDATSMEGLFFGADIQSVWEMVDEVSPVNLVTPSCPPLLLQHGREDRTVPWLQSSSMAEAVNRVLPGRAVLELFDGLDHSDPFFKSEENAVYIAEFFRSAMQ